jgi:NAD(P)H-hydrate epimerase
MRLATASDIRRMDDRAEKEFGLTRLLLMENAGYSVVLAMERVLGSVEGKRVAIFCGKGGNGGDGMCAARHLVSHGASVVVGLAGKRTDLSAEPAAMCGILDRMGLGPREVVGDADLPWVQAAASASDIVIDALLGVGSRPPASGIYDPVVQIINASGKPVVSIDIPTGIDADTGAVPGNAISAVLTVALGLPKRGLVLYPGTMRVGKLVTADLTLPIALLNDPAITSDILLQEEVAELLPVRHPQAHKHSVGRALIVAGSRAMPGASALASEAALIGGAGMVYLASPGSVAGVGRRAEVISRPQAETPSGNLSEAALDDILRVAKEMHGVGIGPGMGMEETTRRLVLKVIESVECPIVVDADGLNALAGTGGKIAPSRHGRILTPHSGEMSRLLGATAESVDADRLEAARRASAQYGSIVILKGARPVVAEPGGRLFIVPTGNPGMATAGSGDVLTGILAALLAQRVPPLSAALLGAYVHGLAGDMARDALTDISMTASDIKAFIPSAFRRISGASGQTGSGEGKIPLRDTES